MHLRNYMHLFQLYINTSNTSFGNTNPKFTSKPNSTVWFRISLRYFIFTITTKQIRFFFLIFEITFDSACIPTLLT